jgi:elongator complex protein 3
VSTRGASPAAPARRRRFAFDVEHHAPALRAILTELATRPELAARSLDAIVRRHPKDGRGFFSRSELIAGARHLAAEGALDGDVEALVARLRLRPVRTQSGVTPVTVLTRPHPCPGACIFCPSDVRMPKSYLADEPGAQRAEDNRFDPYLQTWNRLAAYRAMGHPVDKVELSVLGGTWSAHPEAYQIWFVLRCLEAQNDFGAGVDRRDGAWTVPSRYAAIGERVDGRAGEPGAYNRIVGGFLAAELGGDRLHASETATWEELRRAQRANESSGARCVGIALETRPDAVTPEEVLRLRRLGATKLQIGVQSTRDSILAANRRGHDLAATIEAFRLLRGAGFKLHAHWMPNLLGATPRDDAADFRRLFEDPGLRPDELKIYPGLLVESAELARHHASGAWRPYSDAELVDLLADCLEQTPPWCRVTRVVRDFSAADVAAGTHRANLRELAEAALAARNAPPREIRSREIRGGLFDPAALLPTESGYATSIGRELFLEEATPQGRLAGFLRLSLPDGSAPLPELERSALVRELHVYGAALEIGRRPGAEAQHRGLGRALLARAAERARAAGYRDLAVISSVGTRAYYRRLGFADGPLYQHLALARAVRAGAPVALGPAGRRSSS